MWNQYKDEQQNIEVPNSLKEDTLQKMNTMTVKKKKVFFQWQVITTVCAFVIVSVIGYQWVVPSADPYTTFVDGKTIEEVTIAEGKLVFKKSESNDRYFAETRDATKTKVTKEQFEMEAQVTLPDISFPGFTSDAKAWYIDTMDVLGAKEGTALYAFVHDKQKINMTITTEDKTVKTNSTIEGKDIAVFYQEVLSKTTYVVLLSYNSLSYQITMQGVNQEQFIRYVINFINLL